MRITNIDVTSYSGSFMVGVGNPETLIHVTMTEEERDRIQSVATEIFLFRQATIAKDIGEARPIMLADFTEVVPAPVDPYDDVPF